MAATLSATVAASIDFTYQLANTGLSASKNQSRLSYSSVIANGTGADGTADLIYATQTTIAASGNTTLDLAGSLTDFYGTTITMARVKFIYIHLTDDTTSTDVSVGGGSNPLINWLTGTTPTVEVLNDGICLVGSHNATGYAVTAGTGDVITITNNDASNVATLDICIIGASA